MVLRFYGVRINQKEIYNKSKVYDPLRKGKVWGCFFPKLMFTIQHTRYKMKMWINYKKNVKMPLKVKKLFKKLKPLEKKAKQLGLIKEKRNATITLIRQFLRKGIPVIVEVHSNTWFRTKKCQPYETHTVVIKGYENGNFIVNDPYMAYRGKKGENIKISVSHFKKAWKMPPYYKNSLFILTK